MTTTDIVVFPNELEIPIVLPEGICKDCDNYVPNGEEHAGSCVLRKIHVRNENGCEYFIHVECLLP